MSQWTHVKGTIQLNATPFEFKGEGEEQTKYLPLPEQQFKLMPPLLRHKHPQPKDPNEINACLEFGAEIYSLPRAEPIIEKLFTEILPHNELGLGVTHSLYQRPHDAHMSSSGFDCEDIEKAFKEAVSKMYSADDPWRGRSFERLEKWEGACLGMIQYIDAFILSLRSDIRYCSGVEFMEAWRKFLAELGKYNIWFDEGYLEWEDEYDPHHIYAWRSGYLTDIRHQFMILDPVTNEILYAEKYEYPKDDEGYIDYCRPLILKKEGEWPSAKKGTDGE